MKIFGWLFSWQRKPKKRKEVITSLTQAVAIVSKGVADATRLNYQTAVHSFLTFKTKDDVMLSGITQADMTHYQQWLQQRGMSANTITCYLRSLRALYNKAVKRHLVRDIKPFEKVKTRNNKVVKVALKPFQLQQLHELRLKEDCFQAFARDIFLFSCYAMGMPPTDVAHLEWTQIKHGYMHYQRQKTHRKIVVKLEPCMQAIIDRWGKHDNKYVFPILPCMQYDSFLRQYNRALHALGEKIKFDVPLSSYVARHTWASLAYENNVSLPIISQALGHANPKTTLIYIHEIDNKLLAEANKRVLNKIVHLFAKGGQKYCRRLQK